MFTPNPRPAFVPAAQRPRSAIDRFARANALLAGAERRADIMAHAMQQADALAAPAATNAASAAASANGAPPTGGLQGIAQGIENQIASAHANLSDAYHIAQQMALQDADYNAAMAQAYGAPVQHAAPGRASNPVADPNVVDVQAKVVPTELATQTTAAPAGSQQP